jgi:hypothetical protein
MPGKRQHYLPAAVIGGFGLGRTNKSLRDAAIVVKDLRTGSIRHSTAQNEAHRRALYRLEDPPPGVNPDAIDDLWKAVEQNLPNLVARLADKALAPGDEPLLILYASMAGVRHPTFQNVAEHHQTQRRQPRPIGDQLQWMRYEALLNQLKEMPNWRWRVLHSQVDAPRFMLSDRGWIYVQEPGQQTRAIFLPMGSRVGILGYLDAADLPPRRPPFEEHRNLVPSWITWLNAAAGSDAQFTNALFAHPDDELALRALPLAHYLHVNDYGPFRGRGANALTLLD